MHLGVSSLASIVPSISAKYYFYPIALFILHVKRRRIASYNPVITIMSLYTMAIFPGYNNLVWWGMQNLLDFTVL